MGVLKMNSSEKNLIAALESVLQYGWSWGHPRSIRKEDWQTIREAYKELNGGKEFVPDKNKKAQA